MKCETTHIDLDKLGETYSIPNDIDLKIPSKNNIPSCPLRGYIAFYLDYFRLDVRLPLQPSFAKHYLNWTWLQTN